MVDLTRAVEERLDADAVGGARDRAAEELDVANGVAGGGAAVANGADGEAVTAGALPVLERDALGCISDCPMFNEF